MTIEIMIGWACTFVFAYGLTLCLFGCTYVLTDLFKTWMQERKGKAVKVAAPPANESSAKGGKL